MVKYRGEEVIYDYDSILRKTQFIGGKQYERNYQKGK